MEPFSTRHSTSPLFEELGAQLRIEADHAIAGRWERAWRGRNRLPHNRLFCIAGPRQAGSIGWGDGQRIPLRAGHMYHMPPNMTLEFDFHQGLRMVAFHYDCALYGSFDLCAGMTMVTERVMDVSQTRRLADQLRNIQQRSELVFLQGTLTRLAARFIPGDLQSLVEEHRIYQRYDVVNEEIDLSGAMTRISAIAEIMELSVDQLSKRFRRDLGIPLKHYIDQVVARRAAHLLRHTDKKIKDIAEDLRFRDEFTFSRFVRKHLQLSPRRYRQLSDIERV